MSMNTEEVMLSENMCLKKYYDFIFILHRHTILLVFYNKLIYKYFMHSRYLLIIGDKYCLN